MRHHHSIPTEHILHAPAAGNRVILQSEGELLTCGPGYIQYTGPAPESDAHLVGQARGVMTYARLRDACPCEACIHPTTRQKAHTSAEAAGMAAGVGGDVLPEAMMHAASEDGEAGICVHWPTEGGEHSSFYSLSLLRRLNA